MMNVEARLVAIDNEQRAQKVAHALNYGSLASSEAASTAQWSGNVGNAVSATDSNVIARWVATFTRTDGIERTPMVDFAYDYVLGRYIVDDAMAGGSYSSITARDRHSDDEGAWNDGLWVVGENSVSWKIEIVGAHGNWFYQNSDGTSVNLAVQAISPVPGTLTLARVA